MSRTKITQEEYKKRVLSIMDSKELSPSQIQKLTKIEHYKLMRILDELVKEKVVKKSNVVKRFKFSLEAILPKIENTNQTTENTKVENEVGTKNLPLPNQSMEETKV